ncbi:hypothetical protein JCM10908_005026 [Rhodotorula pacifica]|uniref:uncharacterized protein n=1 Tax=Rhodotorula pacifica TaxID=1495444 RepID=UPI0031731CC9
MSISAPLPSTASSAHPFYLTIALQGPAAAERNDASGSTPLGPTRGAQTTGSGLALDVFDEIDAATSPWTIENPPDATKAGDGSEDVAKRTYPDKATTSSAAAKRASDAVFDCALSDTHSMLYGTGSVDYEPMRDVGGSDAGIEGGLPDWMKETSGRVTSMAVGHLRSGGTAPSNDGAEGADLSKKRRRRSSFRLAVGCEDGNVWIFAHPEAEEGAKLPGTTEEDASHRTCSAPLPGAATPSRAVANSTDALGESSRASASALDSLSPTRPSDTHRSLRSHRSSGSIGSLASLTSPASIRTKRIVSASAAQSAGPSSSFGLREPSLSSASLQSHDFARVQSRPRKASATVSISTSPAEPSTACHSRARTPAPPSITSASDESGLPPFPTSSSPPASPPISPTSMSSIPSVMVFPTSPSGEKTEAASLLSHRRTGSRAKDSIAAGIGLWETDFGSTTTTTTTSGEATPREESEAPSSVPETRRASVDSGHQTRSSADTQKLEPVLQVMTRGYGAVVELQVVAALPSADPEEGIALIVLRESGHLTLVSMLDGRSFGSCDVGSKQASTSRARGVIFDSMQVLQSGPNTFAVCRASSGGAAWAVVDLGTMMLKEGAGPSEPDVSGAVARAGKPNRITARLDTKLTNIERAGNLHFVRAEAHDDGSPTTPIDVQERERLVVWGHESSLVVAWSSSRVRLLRVAGESQLAELDACKVPGLRRLALDSSGHHLCLVFKDKAVAYAVANDRLQAEGECALTGIEEVVFDGGSTVLAAARIRDGSRVLKRLRFEQGKPSPLASAADAECDALFTSSPSQVAASITRVKQLPDDQVLLGYSDGSIAKSSLPNAAAESRHPTPRAQLEGAITLIDVLEFGGRQIVIAGSSLGSAGAWALSDWECLARWTLFASPVKHVSHLDNDDASPPSLRNAVAFVSANSPVAFVSLFPPQHLFTLPGTKSSVELVATSKDEVLVLYRQGLARTCDIKSRELRRSMDRKTAESVVAGGDWHIWFRAEKALRAAPPAGHGNILRIDLRSWLEEAAQQIPWSNGKNGKTRNDDSGSGSPSMNSSQQLDKGENGHVTVLPADACADARQMLSVLCRTMRDESLWALLSALDVQPVTDEPVLDLHSRHATALPREGDSGIWTISPTATTQRLLQIVCLLRIFLNYPDTERPASEAIVYFASCLADAVGPDFAPPSLDILASFWLDKNVELHQAARTLFGTYLAATPDEEVQALLETWSPRLPVSQTGAGVMHHRADHALLLLGLVAIDRMLLLSALLLKDIASSIDRYLRDSTQPYHQAVATELCSRGFATWQNYVDAMALTRQLFSIAIGADPNTTNDLRLLARNATLQIAGVNTPLLMTTLLFDILNTPDAATRNATLKLLGFMIRKKPLVIFTNLPRVVDAVVKCLDPAVSSLRETVQQAATVILNELVRTYPSVDFHGKSQRIAVGTHEGAAVVYDLKTATRLYVLESHSRPVTALSWSPDGHRLVTASLDESRIVAWRVSGGIFGMFMSGAPPRAGSSAQATPFKTYDFHVGDEALMTTAATLEWVTFDWPAERTVRLRIRETALNFGV